MKNKDLEYIKKHYSETLAKICRKLFPTILEHPGVLPDILEKTFAHSKSLGQDIIEQDVLGNFQMLILSKVPKLANEIYDVNTDKTATQLFDEAGYILYPECKTEADIQKFRKYYYRYGKKTPVYVEGKEPADYEDEEICTFEGGRLDECRVWFAVKKNIKDIKRENFKYPKRQDEYGTSVISIQFTKGKYSELSIKNRYNHKVNNPDATFSKISTSLFLDLSSEVSLSIKPLVAASNALCLTS